MKKAEFTKQYIQAQVNRLSFKNFVLSNLENPNEFEINKIKKENLNEIKKEFSLNPELITKRRERKLNRSETRLQKSLNSSSSLGFNQSQKFKETVNKLS